MEMMISYPTLFGGVIPFEFQYKRIGGVKFIGTSKAAGTSFEEFQVRRLTPSQLILRDRLSSRLPEILKESEEFRRLFPDPVEALVELLSNTPGDYAIWREVIEEPYG